MSLKLKKAEDNSIPMNVVLAVNKLAQEEETNTEDLVCNVFPPTGKYMHRSLDMAKIISDKDEDKEWGEYSSKEVFGVLFSFFKSLGIKEQATQLMEYMKDTLGAGVLEKLSSEESIKESLSSPKK